MKTFLLSFIIVLVVSFDCNSQCTISANTNASSLTCGIAPLNACNGVLNVGNGTTPVSILMDATLDLTCLGAIQLILNNASLDFSPGNDHLILAEGSSLILINNSGLIGGSCNASERIVIGTNILASCNGGASADVKFLDILNLGGTGSVTSNSPVCISNSINLLATPPPLDGPYTYSWSGPNLTATTYSSSSSYSLVATSSNGGTYQVKMKSNSGIVMIAEITVTVNSGLATATPVVSVIQPTCTVSTGTLTVTSPVGSGMRYSIDGLNYTNSSGVFTSVVIGSYNVTAKNISGCISPIATVTVVNGQPTNIWNGTSWSAGSPPTSLQRIIFDGDFSSTSDIVGCSCQIISGNIVFNSGNTLSIVNELTVSGGVTLTFEDGASLVQSNDLSVNSGNITFKRKTTALNPLDYTYWSSPVANATLSQLATNSLFYSFNPTLNNWVWQSSGTIMTPGVGYIGRTSYSITNGQILETNFFGVPNNGIITTPIIKSVSFNNLIGNPYPSALDADLFITDASNSGVINGTLYFWTHNTPITNNIYTTNDYAKYNLTGGVVGTGSGILAGTGGILPSRYIAAGQGFMVEAKTSLSNGSYLATFKNSMRVLGTNSNFFRTTKSVDLEKNRIWISLSNTQGAYNQMLLGYVEGATDGMDSMYDGKVLFTGNPVCIYTIVGADDFLSIQGRSLPFFDTDVVPVGYNTTINGQLTISLDNFDGFFSDQNVYLFDKYTNNYQDLKQGSYTFVTTSGTFNDRFDLRYKIELKDYNPSVNNINIVLDRDQIFIGSPIASITKVEVYDILGKLLYIQNNLNTNYFEKSIVYIPSQLLLVKVTLDEQQVFIKKVLKN